MNFKTDITGIILAGGKSSRMKRDKGLIPFNNALFIEHIIHALKPLVRTIIIVSDNSDYDRFGYKRVEDLIKDSGPLAGLYTGLFYSSTDLNFVLSCDIPLINTQILKILIDEYDDRYDLIQMESQNKTMPLIALYRKSCMETCHNLLLSGEKRLRKAVQKLKAKTILIHANWDKFVDNINTVQQLNALNNEIES